MRCERLAGRGGGAAVYVVSDEATGRRFALKVPRAPAGAGGADLERELQVLRRVRHDHLVVLHGSVGTDRGRGILMEYLPGGSAAELVAVRGPVDLGEAVTVLAPVASALAHLHSLGIAHGDVSPANVLFTADGLPKLGDLGLAGLVGAPGPAGGTPGFSAPEAATGSVDRALHPERDVYALGALAWFLLTGRVPGPSRLRPPLSSLRPGAPGPLSDLVEECLSEDPAARPEAAAVERRLFAGVAPQPVRIGGAVHPDALQDMATMEPARDRRGRPGCRGSGRRGPGRGGTGRSGAGRSGSERGGAGRCRRGAGYPFRRAVRFRSLLAAGLALVLVIAGLGQLGQLGQFGTGALQGGPSQEEPPQKEPPQEEPGREEPGRKEPGQESPAHGSAGPRDPLRAAVVLASRRDAALAAANAGALAGVHAPEGTSRAADEATIAALARRGLRYEGLRTELTGLVLREGSGSAGKADGADAAARAEATARVEATSTIGPYRVVDAAGTTVRTVDAPTVQRLVFVLHRSSGGWRVASVLEAPP
ncbi:serine/threonine-protein kinase [Zafaria cholistanensis]|nr:serine/threonine-protein kinase [Zafaria cholistanensis]